MAALTLFKTPLRTTWDVDGDLTETLWWPRKEGRSSDASVVLFMIPGNPGLIEWYEDFLQWVYEGCDFALDIVGVSYLGHSAGLHNPPSNHRRLYSIHEQVEHKIRCIDLLRKQYPDKTEFVIAGHSLGSWVATQILKNRPHHNIRKIIALFPTLKDIARTPNGVRLTPLFSPFSRNMAGLIVDAMNLLPTPVVKGLVRVTTGQVDPALTVTATRMLRGNVVRNALFLAGQEMDVIKDLDHDLLETHFDKYVFYYGVDDEWAPMDHYDEMKEKFPEGKILLCEDSLPHAFVLEHSDVMGGKVAEWLNDMYRAESREGAVASSG